MSQSLTKPDEIRNSLDDEAIDLFWQFIAERQQVWYRRVVEGQPSPWTDDDILREYRFTNVYRQLDPGTQYVIQHILEADSSRQDMIFNVMLYRLIGRLETHDYLGFQSLDDFDAAEFEAQLKHRRDELDETVFTGAYMVSGYNQMGSSDKVENVAALFDKLTADPEFFDQVLAAASLEDAYDLIRAQPGFGNFLSYQVLVDLLYPVDALDGDSVLPFSPDNWSSPGPGAQKGLKQLVTEFNGFDRLAVMRWLRQHQQEEFDRLDLDFPYLETEDGGCWSCRWRTSRTASASSTSTTRSCTRMVAPGAASETPRRGPVQSCAAYTRRRRTSSSRARATFTSSSQKQTFVVSIMARDEVQS